MKSTYLRDRFSYEFFNLSKFLCTFFRFLYHYILHSFDRSYFRAVEKPRLSIETTNICNAKCIFCANTVMERRKQALSIEDFKSAVDQFAKMGSTNIDFNVTIGDPLLDKLIIERARYVTETYPQFKSLGFVTTLQWFHLHDSRSFMESGITWLSISTILSGRQACSNFFGVDLYDQMLKNLIALIEINKRYQNKISIKLDLKPTPQPPEEVIGHPDFQRINAMVDRDLVEKLNSMGYYVDDWGGAVNLPPYLKKRPLAPRFFRPCRFLYSGLIIYSNGKIGACNCRDFEANSDLILGDIKKLSLKEAWESEKLQRLRKEWLMKNNVPNICKTCRHYVY